MNPISRDTWTESRSYSTFNAVILFGSYARREEMPWSDYDLLIIGDFDTPYLERLRILMDELEGIPIPIEPHPYTLKEALRMLERGHPTIVDSIEEGVPLLTSEKYGILIERYRELKSRGKLRRTSTTITF